MTFEVFEIVHNTKSIEFSRIKKQLFISSTQLSAILKNLENFELIKKSIITLNPITIRYTITKKGDLVHSCLKEVNSA